MDRIGNIRLDDARTLFDLRKKKNKVAIFRNDSSHPSLSGLVSFDFYLLVEFYIYMYILFRINNDEGVFSFETILRSVKLLLRAHCHPISEYFRISKRTFLRIVFDHRSHRPSPSPFPCPPSGKIDNLIYEKRESQCGVKKRREKKRGVSRKNRVDVIEEPTIVTSPSVKGEWRKKKAL